MFSSSTKGTEATFILTSLVQTAISNKLNPPRYIEYLLNNLDYLKENRVAIKYLPWSKSLPDELKISKVEIDEALKETDKEIENLKKIISRLWFDYYLLNRELTLTI